MTGETSDGTGSSSSWRGAVAALAVVGVLASGCNEGSQEPSGSPETSSSDSPPATVSSTPSADPSTAPSSPDTASPSASASKEPEAEPTSANPVIKPVPRRQWKRMVDANMWRPGCPVTRQQLRRVEVNHVTFSGDVRRGVLVVHADVAKSVSRIFTRLFESEFRIRRMRPLEKYDGDSNASLRDDNTGAYNCRRPSQINAPPMKSPHAHGRAIDVNPRENPWVDLRCDCWFPSPKNRKREPGPGVIVKGGVVWRTFKAEGWIWQNIDVPDYMHFDTGYPSRPYKGPNR